MHVNAVHANAEVPCIPCQTVNVLDLMSHSLDPLETSDTSALRNCTLYVDVHASASQVIVSLAKALATYGTCEDFPLYSELTSLLHPHYLLLWCQL